MAKILVVGAGFSGAVHARELAAAGHDVDVIDQRPHIGGNAYDAVNDAGIRVHLYGPHLFHSKNRAVIAWLRQFGEFVPYTHKVRALLPSGVPAPLPINLDTVNLVFGTCFETADEVQAHLKRIADQIDSPRNAAEHLYATIGRDLTDLFFRPYTKKMWALDLEEMAVSVVRRIPLRFDRTDTYFSDDEMQMLPRDGYESVFRHIFEHPRIAVSLNTPFQRAMTLRYDHCFNAMPIDVYFDQSEGELPYRSIRFDHVRHDGAPPPQTWSVTNFTDAGPVTRATRWDCLPHHVVHDRGQYTITLERPCDYRDNNLERYYPVKTADDRYQDTYRVYRDLAARTEPRMTFIGRCGTYQYLDMDQVINQSLTSVREHLARLALVPS
jgi:UDP-galactopyranose mutase